MRISRVKLINYRNFEFVDIPLGDHAVIVGENKVGKSNFLSALRLVLDPSLPDAARQLRFEDFWDGLPRPLAPSARIEVSVDLADFTANADHVALLADHLIELDPMVARLTYAWQPRADLEGAPRRPADYEGLFFGGGRPDNPVHSKVRRRLPLDVLPALRDAESALSNWRTSPLRPLLDQVANQLDSGTLQTLSEGLTAAAAAVGAVQEVRHVSSRISERVTRMVGAAHGLATHLGLAPTDPDRLVRSLRLFIDGTDRGVNEASLGSANLLYLALKSLELELAVGEGTRDHTFLAIEEPEAHLHPHVQRLVYRDALRTRAHLGAPGELAPGEIAVTKVLTTHSPHVVSVSPVKSLVVLRRESSGTGARTRARSAASLDLTVREEEDLERYLDVSRGELVFARGVLLVEGDAEEYLLPAFGRMLNFDFDELGISVCSVSGTNFAPYVKLLRSDGLDIPFAVLTDWDPSAEPDVPALGHGRVRDLLSLLGGPTLDEFADETTVRTAGATHGIFPNNHTLEVDLFRSGQHEAISDVLCELTKNGACRTRANRWRGAPGTLDTAVFLSDIKPIGKGRFAQRLAQRVTGNACPAYITQAIAHVATRCS
ncbi:ATP-dependent nuclease [Gemmatimonas sp.]|uniref:ATP-dependent nuclease n=1 Tax=Gemmatimonas sp. TaxID=1962908 RepID=UPI003DA6348A